MDDATKTTFQMFEQRIPPVPIRAFRCLPYTGTK